MARIVCFSCIGVFLAMAVACSGTTHVPSDAVVTHSETGKTDKRPNVAPEVSEVDDAAKSEQAPTRAADEERVTLYNYYRVKSGMTYADVCAILGPGEEFSSGGGFCTLVWKASGLFGGTASISFINGKVSARAQVGLAPGGPSREESEQEVRVQKRHAEQVIADQKRVAEAERQAEEKRVADEARRRKEATRTWTESETERTIDAEFISYTGGKIKLRKSNGQEVVLPLERLSEQDQAWVHDWAKKRSR